MRLVKPGTAFGSITTTGPAHERGHRPEAGNVAAHAEDGGGGVLEATERGEGQARRVLSFCKGQRDSSRRLDDFQFEALRRDKLCFHAALRPDEEDLSRRSIRGRRPMRESHGRRYPRRPLETSRGAPRLLAPPFPFVADCGSPVPLESHGAVRRTARPTRDRTRAFDAGQARGLSY